MHQWLLWLISYGYPEQTVPMTADRAPRSGTLFAGSDLWGERSGCPNLLTLYR